MQKLDLGVGIITLAALITGCGPAVAQPASPVEQRLGTVIASLMIENARLAADLDAARQTIAKLQAELDGKKKE